MSNRKNPETSNEAYRSLDVATLNERYKLIIQALTVLGEANTEEVAAFLKVRHETIWKRFSELSNLGLIYRPGNKRLMKSGRNGFTWSLTNSATPKTSKTQKELLKGTKPVHESAKEMQGSIQKAKALQLGIFSEIGA